MNRRDFLKMSAMTGLAVSTPIGWRSATADSDSYDQGPIYLFIYAGGGWDTTMLCDPKGGSINRAYGTGDILSSGNIHYPPLPGYKEFFDAYYQDLLIINGIDMSSASHPGGMRYIASGRLENGDFPAFGAVAAGLRAPHLPLSFLSFDGYSTTGNLVALARIRDQLSQLNQFNKSNFFPANRNIPYYSDGVRGVINRALSEDSTRRLQDQHLPLGRHGISALENARISTEGLKRLDQYLPEELTGSQLDGQVQMALAAAKAGICVSANLGWGGFDTHDRNDESQQRNLSIIVTAIDTAMKEAERLRLRDRMVIIVGSEFARTPEYNPGDGKDHWPVGSMMVLGPNIRGNRVIGGTDEGQMLRKIDPTTLALSSAPNAIKLKPDHIHLALRAHAGVIDSPALAKFPIPGERLPLFG